MYCVGDKRLEFHQQIIDELDTVSSGNLINALGLSHFQRSGRLIDHILSVRIELIENELFAGWPFRLRPLGRKFQENFYPPHNKLNKTPISCAAQQV